jgi:hypothetical protein
MQKKVDLSELVVAEQVAKREWEQAVQIVKTANENVGKAHERWLAANNALTIAKEASRPKAQFVKARAMAITSDGVAGRSIHRG